MPAEPEPVAIQGFSALHLIGRGGFSTVYRAVQERLNRTVAIKVLHVDVSDAPARDRFLNECAAAGKLANHPNIVTVYDSGFTTLGEPYLVMEYCDQGSLADQVRNAPLEGWQALSVMVKLAGALATAHAGGILHRDIKPENVLFTSYGEPALADFGIASVTSGAQKSFTVAALTPNHAAPEVLDGGRASASSDVYSLASTGYQILAGTPPFQRDREEGLLSFFGRVVRDPAPPLARADVPAGLAATLARGLAKSPAERHATAESFGLALQEAQRAAGQAATELRSPAAAATAPPASHDAVIAPPPPPSVLPAAEGDATMLRPRDPVTPKPKPGGSSAKATPLLRRRPTLAAGLVLVLLLCGVGGYFGYARLFGGDGGDKPLNTAATQGMATPTPTTVATATAASDTPTPASDTPTSGSTASTANPRNSAAQQPTGPQIVYFRIKQKPLCPAGTSANPIAGVPVTIEWKIVNADGTRLLLDGDLYADYGLQGSETLSFPCNEPPGTIQTHTYKITTLGGGAAKSATVKAESRVNAIPNV